MATNQTSYVTKLLYWEGADSFEYTPVFKGLIKYCNVFIDIGANSGYYSLLAATIKPDICIHAFEPAQGPLHYLKENVRLNKLGKQIEVHSLALSSRSGEVNFYEVTNKKYTYLTHNLGGIGSLKADSFQTAYPVKTETLDRFVLIKSISAVDFVKIDTEGTENFILEGAEETIRKFLPIIVCETLFNRIEDKLELLMKKHEYLFFNHENGYLRKVETLIRQKDDGVKDCFFIHSSKINLISKFIKT